MKILKVTIIHAFKIFKKFKSDNYPPFQKFFQFLNFIFLFFRYETFVHKLSRFIERYDFDSKGRRGGMGTTKSSPVSLKDTTLIQRGGEGVWGRQSRPQFH